MLKQQLKASDSIKPNTLNALSLYRQMPHSVTTARYGNASNGSPTPDQTSPVVLTSPLKSQKQNLDQLRLR